jgi:hypothetical protein
MNEEAMPIDLSEKRGKGFWFIIVIGAFFSVMFLVGQTLCLFDYDFTVSLGLQESVHEITAVGVAYAKGYAFGDTLIYIPLLVFGIFGLIKRKAWGFYSMFGALAITAYWPITNLYTIFAGKDSMNIAPDKYILFSIILPLFAIYGLWGMWYLYKNRNRLIAD